MTTNTLETTDDEKRIAVIGMAVRVPGAESLDELWRISVEGLETIRRDALPAEGPAAEDYVPAVAEVRRLREFDAEFFAMTPREARLTDPQHRMFLEECWHALEDAGIDPDRFDGDIAVFGSSSANAYLPLNLMADSQLSAELTGNPALVQSNDKDYMPVRAAYKLGLTGPAVAVQTACSSSLVGVVQAADALMEYRCDAALVGGVSVRLPEGAGYRHAEGGFQSGSGRCRPFDASADGTVFGTGAGAVVLRRLSDAIADVDRIHAVIRGGAVNNDGPDRSSFTAPSITGQTAVLTEALDRAGIAPETVDLIEAHGTGTRLGDPIEMKAIDAAYGDLDSRDRALHVTAIKGGIGHLLAASGVVGLIRTCLALEHGMIPPVVGLERVNPIIGATRTAAVLGRQAEPWPEHSHPRRAAVSSFGIGGTNAHVVLEEAPPAREPHARAGAQWLLASARSPEALDAVLSGLNDVVSSADAEGLSHIAGTLAHRRHAFAHRACALVRPGSAPVWVRSDQAPPAGADPEQWRQVGRWLTGATGDLPVARAGVADLPGYPFARIPYWVDAEPAAGPAGAAGGASPTGEPGADVDAPERVEQIIYEMWCGLIGEDVGDRGSHFLDQGGDSLTIVQLVTRIHERFPVRLDFQDVMDNASVRELSAVVVQRIRRSASEDV